MSVLRPHFAAPSRRRALVLMLPVLAACAWCAAPSRADTPPPYIRTWSLGFTGAPGIAVHPVSGDVYVTNPGAAQVARYTASGVLIGTFGTGFLRLPNGVATDANPNGYVYVAEPAYNLIQRFTLAGAAAGSWPVTAPKGVALDSLGTVYVVSGDSVIHYTGAGALLGSWGGTGSGNGQFASPFGIAVDRAGNVYVADTGNHRIQKFDATGAYLAQWGTNGTGDGLFANPWGVAVDRYGHVFVSDTGNHRIQAFDGAGVYLCQWGTLGTGAGQFNGPRAAATSTDGLVHVLDTGNNRVQQFGAMTATTLVSAPNPSVAGQDVTLTATVRPAPASGIVTFFDGVTTLGPAALSGGVATLTFSFGAAGAHSLTAQYPGDATHAASVSPVDTQIVNPAQSSTALISLLNPSGTGQEVTFRATVTPIPPGSGTPTGIVTFLDGVTAIGAASLANGSASVIGPPLGTGSHSITASYGGDADFAGSASAPLAQTVLAPETAPAYITQWGSPGSGAGQLDRPRGVALAPSGNLYLVDRNNSRVQYARDFGGGFGGRWGTNGSGAGQFDLPTGVAVDGSGNVYVSDTGNHRIEKFSDTGGFIQQWGSFGSGSGQFDSPAGVAIGPGPFFHVYVVDSGNRRIERFTTSGGFVSSWGSPGSGPGQFELPTGIAVDAATGNVYVADTGNNRIQKFTSSGSYLAEWGSPGAGNGRFSSPAGLATDGAGNVYVADSGNHRIQKFTGGGAYLAQWGTQGSGEGQFQSPYGVVLNAAGTVLVTDELNHRVETFGIATSTVLASGVNPSVFGQAVNFTATVSPAPAGGVVTFYDGASPIAVAGLSGGVATAPISSLAVGSHSLTAAYGGGIDHARSTSPAIVQVVDPAVPAFTLGSDPSPSGIGQEVTFSVTMGAAPPGGGTPTGTVTFRDGAASLGAVALDGGSASLTAALPGAGAHSITVTYPGDGSFTAGTSGARIHVVLGPDVPPGHVTQWGAPGAGNGQFGTPMDVATDAARNVYVADRGNHRIQKFSAAGGYLTRWGTHGMLGNGEFDLPSGVAVDGGGAVYVCDTGNHRIQKFTSGGLYLAQWGSQGGGDGQFLSPGDLVVSGENLVYVCDTGNHRIQVFSAAGAYLAQWGTQGGGPGQLQSPAAIALDGAGSLYVCDTGNHRIQVFSAAGTHLRQWGSSGSGNGQFQSPGGVALEPAGNVYVADTGNHRIQKFTEGGAYLAQWGSPGSGAGEFDSPAGLSVDAAGFLLVADAGNDRIQKFRRPARIASVTDVAQDQGRQVRIRFLADAADVAASPVPIVHYDVFRRIDLSPAAAHAAPRSAATPQAPRAGGPPAVLVDGWDFVGALSAYADSAYNLVVPTLADSNASGRNTSVFFVRAATATPSLYFDSRPDSGASVDNLPPAAPAPFTAVYEEGATHLHWGRSTEPDFWHYRLYRGADIGFTPGPASLIASLADTGYSDPGTAGGFYRLSAVDVGGNEGPHALVTPHATTAVPGAGPARFGIERPSPNPATGAALTVRFTLLDGAPARLELLDLGGRRIAARDVGMMGAGRHIVELPGDRRLAPGLYLIRLRQGARTSTVRALVIE